MERFLHNDIRLSDLFPLTIFLDFISNPIEQQISFFMKHILLTFKNVCRESCNCAILGRVCTNSCQGQGK